MTTTDKVSLFIRDFQVPNTAAAFVKEVSQRISGKHLIWAAHEDAGKIFQKPTE